MAVLLAINFCGLGSPLIDLAFFGAVVVSELSIWIMSRTMFRHLFTFPVNLETLQARWGVWVMIVIGESVIQLLHSFNASGELVPTLVFMGVALLLLFALAMQYFDSCQVEWYEHALTKSAVAGVSWIWLHVSMTHYIFRLGLWLRTLSDAYAAGEEVTAGAARSFSVSLGLVSGLTTVIRMSNSLPDSSASLVSTIYASEARTVLTLLFRIFVSVVQVVIGFVGIKEPLYLLLAQCLLTLLTTALDVVNEIHTTSLQMKEAEAKASQPLIMKSLKHFPRQWSRLQLVHKQSLLEMNLMEDEGVQLNALTPTKSGVTEAEGDSIRGGLSFAVLSDTEHKDGCTDYSTGTIVDIDLKKAVEKQLLKQERVPHFDARFPVRPARQSVPGTVAMPQGLKAFFKRVSPLRVLPLSTLPEAVSEISRRISSHQSDSPNPTGRRSRGASAGHISDIFSSRVSERVKESGNEVVEIGKDFSLSGSGDGDSKSSPGIAGSESHDGDRSIDIFLRRRETPVHSEPEGDTISKHVVYTGCGLKGISYCSVDELDDYVSSKSTKTPPISASVTMKSLGSGDNLSTL
jgi:hypothetical protein